MSEIPSSIYDAAQRRSAYPEGTEFHFWSRTRVRILYDKLPPLDADDLVLDVGCGPGAVVQAMRQKGVDCIGCDLARYSYGAGGSNEYLHYEQDAFELPEDTRRRVRLIMLLDVLEHLERPDEFLSRCIDAFPNLQYVLMTMPARQELWSNFDEYFDHFRRYDRRSVAALCESAGLSVDSLGYFFHSLYLVVGAMKFVRGRRGVDVEPVTLHWMHDLLGRLFHLEEKIVPSALPGTSIYAMARVARREATTLAK